MWTKKYTILSCLVIAISLMPMFFIENDNDKPSADAKTSDAKLTNEHILPTPTTTFTMEIRSAITDEEVSDEETTKELLLPEKDAFDDVATDREPNKRSEASASISEETSTIAIARPSVVVTPDMMPTPSPSIAPVISPSLTPTVKRVLSAVCNLTDNTVCVRR